MGERRHARLSRRDTRGRVAARAARWARLRLRQSAHLRDLTDETSFSVGQLIQPLFVVQGETGCAPIPGLGRNQRLGERAAIEQVSEDVDAFVRHFLLFPVPAARSGHPRTFPALRRAVRTLKNRFGDAIHLWVDICLCSATTHGHCAVLGRDGSIDLSRTLDALSAAAVEAVEAGADGVSPSDMMDGRTAALRDALDAAGHDRIPIMSYSTKFASHFYGPFRAAADSAPRHGDRRQYQIDVRARRDAIESSRRCAAEGADLLMVKPGLLSLDLIAPIARVARKPVGAYQVSGEYAALLGLAEQGFGDYGALLKETLLVFRRAGAAYVITYGARDAHGLGIAR